MNNRTFEQFTEAEFLELVKKICDDDYASERAHGHAIFQLNTISEHPDGSDLIYYPKAGSDDSPEGIVKTIKEWRAAHGKPGFKNEDAS